jgi:hypothetical protein
MAYSAFAFSGLGFGFMTLSCAASGRQQAASRHSRNESSFATVGTLPEFLFDLEDAKSLRGDLADPASDRFMIYGITKIALLN